MIQLRVFIVDDDRDFAESMALTLEGRGYFVEQAHSGEEAIQKFSEKDFDIAFMDVKLPRKNGVESFLEIRKLKPEAKVVMMTGYSVEQLFDQAVKNGAWGVLHKPLDMAKVIEMIERIGEYDILIADDDPDFLESIMDVLKRFGKRVLIAQNGKEAVDMIRENSVDILILDLRMPLFNGLETYLELKKTGDHIPTIIITAFAEEENAALEKFRRMSVNEILKKPFDPNDLIASVERTARELINRKR